MASATLTAELDDSLLSEVCGINSVDIELGRQTFVRLWNDYNFKVKTFQESVIPSYQFPELRAETVSDPVLDAVRSGRVLIGADDTTARKFHWRSPRGARDYLCVARQYLQVWVC